MNRDMEDENVSVPVWGWGKSWGSPYSLLRRECMSMRGTRFKYGLADAHVVRQRNGPALCWWPAIMCPGLIIWDWPTEPGSSALLCAVFMGSHVCYWKSPLAGLVHTVCIAS